MPVEQADPEGTSGKRERWLQTINTLDGEGLSYSSPVVESGRHRREQWVRIEVSGRTIRAWQPYRQTRKVRAGEQHRFLLFSVFVPSSADPSLQSVQKGFVEHSDTNEFSAKGRVVRVVRDWAVVDSGFHLVCELVPEYFLHEEQQTIRREWKVGDTVLETGILKIQFL